MDQNLVLGAWKLKSFVYKAEDGSNFYPYGKDASGIIIYEKGGYMSAVITRTDRPRLTTEDFGLLSDEEKIALAKGFMTYTGNYEVQSDRILHNIEIGYIPNWAGTTFVRFPSFDDDGNLVLATPPINLRGKSFTGYLIWKKAD
ncbi:MAG: lipocalin-like domain-containing protein [Syntrophomonas sp.]